MVGWNLGKFRKIHSLKFPKNAFVVVFVLNIANGINGVNTNSLVKTVAV